MVEEELAELRKAWPGEWEYVSRVPSHGVRLVGTDLVAYIQPPGYCHLSVLGNTISSRTWRDTKAIFLKRAPMVVKSLEDSLAAWKALEAHANGEGVK